MENNKYLTKICALLKPLPGQKKSTDTSSKKPNKYSAKITKLNKRRKPHNGDTIYRQHKVYK